MNQATAIPSDRQAQSQNAEFLQGEANNKRVFDNWPQSQSVAILQSQQGILEKVQGATRLGATGLRVSERKSASERVSERTSENLSKNPENL